MPEPELKERLRKHAELVARVEQLPDHPHKPVLLAVLRAEKPTAREAGIATGRELHHALEEIIADYERAVQAVRDKTTGGVTPLRAFAAKLARKGYRNAIESNRALLRFVLEHKLHEHE